MDKRLNTQLKKGKGGQTHASERPLLEPVVSRYMAIEAETRELEDCRREQGILAREIKHPNKSHPHGVRVKLVRAIKRAADKCHRLLVALRLLRKGPNRNR
jgi:hypothetical protein